jgi:hypothetical protein
VCGQIRQEDGTFVNPPPSPDMRSYKEKRQEEYPEIGEQLDAVLKAFNLMRLNGQDLPEDLDEVIGEWLSVKNKYPKPE